MPGYLADTNIWIAFYFENHQNHCIAERFLGARSNHHPVYLARAIEVSILRLLSTASLARAHSHPVITNRQATIVLANWRAQARVRCLDVEPEGTRELWFDLAAIPSASPKVWMDAYLAALAIRGDLPLATLDTDFLRFKPAGLDLCLLTE